MRNTRKMLWVAATMAAITSLPVQEARSQGKGVDQGSAPLSVRVLPPSPSIGRTIRFELNQPAYVAAFIIYPGAGVRLIYPEYGGHEQVWTAGDHVITLAHLSFDGDTYRTVLGITGRGPRYFYLIASRHPMGVDRFIHKPALLADAVGQAGSRSFLIDAQVNALTTRALSLGSDTTAWDADSYMLWPDVRHIGR